MRPFPGIASYLGYLLPLVQCFYSGLDLTQNLSAILYPLRNRTYMTNTESTLSSVALSTTFEHAEPVTDKPMLGKPLAMRPKRGFGESSKEVAYKIPFLRIRNTRLIWYLTRQI